MSLEKLHISFIVAVVAVLFCSCSSSCCRYEVFGADEFVLDSYRIREGKFSILEMSGHCVEDLSHSALEEYVDTIHEDDVLNLAIYHPSRADLVGSVASVNASMGFRVQEGSIFLPDVARVQVAGLTLPEACRTIKSAFEKEIRDVEVYLDYRLRLSRKVDLTGLVTAPCMAVDGKIRLYEVLSRAQVPVSANFFMSYVLRDGQPLPVDMYKLMAEGDMSQNVVMRAGDKIHIAPPNASKVMVMGEVGLPRAVDIPNGFMPLCEALVSVGGIPFTGDRNRIQVIRGDLTRPKIYVLSWQHIVHLPNDSLLLMPGDTVYVCEKPITQWNRFISQLLPSLSGFQSGCATYQGLCL